MPVRLISSIVLAVLFVVSVFGQEQEYLSAGELLSTPEGIGIDFVGGPELRLFVANGSGLEAVDYRNIRVLVEDLTESLTEIGLTRERVRTRAEL